MVARSAKLQWLLRMPALSNTQPTAVTLVEGDKLLYTGTCTLQVNIVLPSGSTFPLKSVVSGTFYTAPVSGDYELSVKGTCCNVGTYELFPSTGDCCPDYEEVTVCDAETGTLWIQWYKVDGDIVTVLTPWEDTGRSCEEPIVTTADFCIQP